MTNFEKITKSPRSLFEFATALFDKEMTCYDWCSHANHNKTGCLVEKRRNDNYCKKGHLAWFELEAEE